MHALCTTHHTSSIEAAVASLKEFQLDDIFDMTVLGRAYEYVSAVKMTNRTAHTMSAKVSSTLNAYTVDLQLREGHLLGSCTCPFQGPCKHIAAVMISKIQPL